jgi:hypothetical protein
VRRPIVLLVALILALGPGLRPTSAAQDAKSCPIFGKYRGFFIQNPNADTVVVRYDFTIPAGMFLPMGDYRDTLTVYVEEGSFDLVVDAKSDPSAVVLVEDAGRRDVRQTAVEPDTTAQGLDAGDLVFHEASSYEYRNVGSVNGVLIVSVVVSRDTLQDAMLPEQRGQDGPQLDHTKICVWCILFGPEADSESASSPATAAKRLPAIQCRGG